MKNLKVFVISLSLSFLALQAQADPLVNIDKAIDLLSKINAQNLSSDDQLRLESGIDKIKLAQSEIKALSGSQVLVKDLQALQGLIGSLIAEPGTVFTRGPKLKRSVQIAVDVDFARIIQRVIGQNIGVGGSLSCNNSDEVAARYNSFRGEYMSVLGQVLALGESVRPIVGASLTWARSNYVLSQPECISIAGWSFKDQCS
jgi:hypothetical protein